jgi:hypothetical protein
MGRRRRDDRNRDCLGLTPDELQPRATLGAFLLLSETASAESNWSRQLAEGLGGDPYRTRPLRSGRGGAEQAPTMTKP